MPARDEIVQQLPDLGVRPRGQVPPHPRDDLAEQAAHPARLDLLEHLVKQFVRAQLTVGEGVRCHAHQRLVDPGTNFRVLGPSRIPWRALAPNQQTLRNALNDTLHRCSTTPQQLLTKCLDGPGTTLSPR